jgi:hypothetical protein
MSNNEYRELKRRHESAAVDSFVDWLNRTSGAHWQVTDRPNPPDAIIADGSSVSWVEHADLYRGAEEARSEMSFITPGKTHIPHSESPIYDPDRRTAMALVTLLQDKLSNRSYRSAYEQYGRGILLISERDPLIDNQTIAEIDHVTEEVQITNDNGYFCKVYLAIRSEQGMSYGEISYRRG